MSRMGELSSTSGRATARAHGARVRSCLWGQVRVRVTGSAPRHGLRGAAVKYRALDHGRVWG
jgi:hypothetical protein